MTDFPVSKSHTEERTHRRMQVGEPRATAQESPSASDMDSRIPLQDSERTRCEVWTRVMGYHRPVSAFNAGKLTEHKQRRYFIEYRTRQAHRTEQAA